MLGKENVRPVEPSPRVQSDRAKALALHAGGGHPAASSTTSTATAAYGWTACGGIWLPTGQGAVETGSTWWARRATLLLSLCCPASAPVSGTGSAVTNPIHSTPLSCSLRKLALGACDRELELSRKPSPKGMRGGSLRSSVTVPHGGPRRLDPMHRHHVCCLGAGCGTSPFSVPGPGLPGGRPGGLPGGHLEVDLGVPEGVF